MGKRIRLKLEILYSSSKGYWKGQEAIKKLAIEAKVSSSKTREWLSKQAKTVAERLFSQQYAQEMITTNARSREWVNKITASYKSVKRSRN